MQKCPLRFIVFCIFFVYLVSNLFAAEEDILNTKVNLPKTDKSVYDSFKVLSEITGYFFIYDSNIIDNKRKVKIPHGEYSLRDAIHRITNEDDLSIEVVKNYVILSLPSSRATSVVGPVKNRRKKADFFTINSSLRNYVTGEPIQYGSISVKNTSIGTITNSEGKFILTLPDSLANSQIRISHLGYSSLELNMPYFAKEGSVVYIHPIEIPLQEVIINKVDPYEILRELINRRKENYSQMPLHITSFYREGITYDDKIWMLTEAVLKLYKDKYSNNAKDDQIKMLKMRNLVYLQNKGSIEAKLKSGLHSIIVLDIMKNFPDFIASKGLSPYKYTYKGIRMVDDRKVNVISFEQKSYREEPLYRGDLYIDMENYALLQAEFEINPMYIKKADEMIVVKKSPGFSVIPQSVRYTVSYKPLNGIYHINYIRGDIRFRVENKNRLFGSSPLRLWFDMINCEIDSTNVTPFKRSEQLLTEDVFADMEYTYDPDFWENFNVILPEERLKKMIRQYFSEKD